MKMETKTKYTKCCSSRGVTVLEPVPCSALVVEVAVSVSHSAEFNQHSAQFQLRRQAEEE